MNSEIIQSIVRYSELIAAIVGTFFFYKYKETHLKYLLYLLWFIVIVEFSSTFLKENEILIYKDEQGVRYNLWLFNLLEIVTYLTFFYIYKNSITNLIHKKWVNMFFGGYILLSIINWVFIQNFVREWSELPYLFGSVTLIICIIFYFIEILKSEKILVYHRMLLFWISIGALLFYTGGIPFSININGYAIIPGFHDLFLIVYVLAITMYLLFTFGFIWSRKE